MRVKCGVDYKEIRCNNYKICKNTLHVAMDSKGGICWGCLNSEFNKKYDGGTKVEIEKTKPELGESKETSSDTVLKKRVTRSSIIDNMLKSGITNVEEIVNEVLKVFSSDDLKKIKSYIYIRKSFLKSKGVIPVLNKEGVIQEEAKQE